MTLHERLKAVTKWHFRGTSERKIGEMLGMSRDQVHRDIVIITDRIKHFDDLDAYIKDVVARTGEQIAQIDELLAEQWKLLDWASKERIETDAFGNALRELNDLGLPAVDSLGAPIYRKGPNRPGVIATATAQIQSNLKQKAELLKLIGNKVDISISLNMTMRAQALILDKLKTLSPEVYASLYDQLQVLADSGSGEQLALNPAREDFIDADFHEAEVEERHDAER